MERKTRIRRMGKALFAVGAMGTVLGSSCTTSDILAVADGIQAVAQRFDGNRSDTNISFGDWLLSELGD